MRRPLLFTLGVLWLVACGGAAPEDRPAAPARTDVILATTTSTQDSGLLDALLPAFEAASGYRVKTIAVGTGEALAMGSRGDADVLLAHAPAKEREVVATGAAINRRLVMHNEFIIAGPASDPANIRGLESAAAALERVAGAAAPFVSRGDNSGTHFRERSLWKAAGLEPAGPWYLEAGQGMGATLLVASERGAYVLTDRGTFLAIREHLHLEPMVAGDPPLLNPYGVMEVNPERFPRVNHAGARAFADFLVSPAAQEIIGRFGVERFGEPLFHPDAGSDGAALGF